MRQMLIGVVMLATVLGPQAYAEELNLRQCVARALTQNPELLASGARIEQAQAAIDQAQSSYLPKVTASITASRTNDPLNVFGMKLMQQSATFNDFGAAEFTGPAALGVAPRNLNQPADYSNVNTRLEAQMPVYTGGQIDAYVRQAKAYLEAAQSGDVAARQQLTFMVYQAFEGVHTAKAYADAAEQGVKAAEAFVRTAENLTAQGILVKSELLTARVHLENVRLQHEQAINQRAIALDQLKMLMGMSLDSSVSLVTGAGVVACDCDPTRMNAKALEHNPRLRALRKQLESAGAGLDAAKAAYLPTVGIMARQDWNDDALALNHGSYLVAGVVNWTLTDFGVTKGSVDRARASQSELAARLQQAEQEVLFKVSESYRKGREAEKRAQSLELNLTQAEEAARLVRQRHEGGVATITEVLVAETQLQKAKADLIAARHELHTQRATLRLLVGELDENFL